jgi:hypothetical protein
MWCQLLLRHIDSGARKWAERGLINYLCNSRITRSVVTTPSSTPRRLLDLMNWRLWDLPFPCILLLDFITVKSGCMYVHMSSQKVVRGVLLNVNTHTHEFCTTWQHVWTRGYKPPCAVLQSSRSSATPTSTLLEHAMQGSRALQEAHQLSLHVKWCHLVQPTVPMLWLEKWSRYFRRCFHSPVAPRDLFILASGRQSR